jgi:hypothetical protein
MQLCVGLLCIENLIFIERVKKWLTISGTANVADITSQFKLIVNDHISERTTLASSTAAAAFNS